MSTPSKRVAVDTVEIPIERWSAWDRMRAEFMSGQTAWDKQVRDACGDPAQFEVSLKHLFQVAQGDSGQCRYIAAFLAGLYNGTRFPFDMTNLRAIDADLFEHCMVVLRKDSRHCEREVHTYFERGGSRFEQMIHDWRLDKIPRKEMEARGDTADTRDL